MGVSIPPADRPHLRLAPAPIPRIELIHPSIYSDLTSQLGNTHVVSVLTGLA